MGTDRYSGNSGTEIHELLNAEPVQQQEPPRAVSTGRRTATLAQRTDQRQVLPKLLVQLPRPVVRRQAPQPAVLLHFLLQANRRKQRLLQQFLLQQLQPVPLRLRNVGLLQRLLQLLRPRHLRKDIRRFAGMGNAPALARRLLLAHARGHIHALHAQVVEIFHHQRR